MIVLASKKDGLQKLKKPTLTSSGPLISGVEPDSR